LYPFSEYDERTGKLDPCGKITPITNREDFDLVLEEEKRKR
tara:strand:- start:232 stop:354 length:123 start_codon:yes stop_codon:yes gene_type:complete